MSDREVSAVVMSIEKRHADIVSVYHELRSALDAAKVDSYVADLLKRLVYDVAIHKLEHREKALANSRHDCDEYKKVLEATRTRLSEVEKQYGVVVEERNHLADKVSQLQRQRDQETSHEMGLNVVLEQEVERYRQINNQLHDRVETLTREVSESHEKELRDQLSILQKENEEYKAALAYESSRSSKSRLRKKLKTKDERIELLEDQLRRMRGF